MGGEFLCVGGVTWEVFSLTGESSSRLRGERHIIARRWMEERDGHTRQASAGDGYTAWDGRIVPSIQFNEGSVFPPSALPPFRRAASLLPLSTVCWANVCVGRESLCMGTPCGALVSDFRVSWQVWLCGAYSHTVRMVVSLFWQN